MRRSAAGRLATALLFGLLLAACGSSGSRGTPPRTYVVKPGDTLYAIAWRHDLDWHDLARWNGIGADAAIRVGQRLVLRGSAAKSPPPRRTVPALVPPAVAGPAPVFAWPVPGRVLGEQRQPSGGFGLRLAAQPGEPVRAAADGRVAYVGAGLRSYGQLVIVKHADGWLTAYGYNRATLVREGDTVARGQALAEAGTAAVEGGGTAPQLYFEVRRLGQAVDPRPLLPKR